MLIVRLRIAAQGNLKTSSADSWRIHYANVPMSDGGRLTIMDEAPNFISEVPSQLSTHITDRDPGGTVRVAVDPQNHVAVLKDLLTGYLKRQIQVVVVVRNP